MHLFEKKICLKWTCGDAVASGIKSGTTGAVKWSNTLNGSCISLS